MRIVMTGGGTAGHVTPNIALIPKLRELGFDIQYIGTKAGMERQLIEREGIPYHAVKAGKLRRYLDWNNVKDVFKIGVGFIQAFAVIQKLKPDIVFSKGGFVSSPVVWASWIHRVPVVIHESDMTPGLANKLSMPFAAKICYAFPETAAYINADKGVLTGIPIREGLYGGNAATGKKLCGFLENKPVMLIMGGSLGSEKLNSMVRSCLDKLLGKYQICHICGKGGLVAALDGKKGYRQFEYVNEELPHLFAMTDIIVSRAGATSLFEILALRKPNLLVPLSKQASRGDQILNARSFEKQGFSRVLMEENLNETVFVDNIDDIARNKEAFIRAMSQSGLKSGVEEVIRVITETCRA